MPLPIFCLRMALLYAALAMALGMHMAMSKDFSLAIAHAHLAIIGWFGLISTGFVYRNFPQLAARGGWLVAIGLAVGVPLLAVGIGMGTGVAAMVGGALVLASIVWLAIAAWITPLG